MEFSNRPRETEFPGATGVLTGFSSHVIHWVTAKIDKITAKTLKAVEEFAFW